MHRTNKLSKLSALAIATLGMASAQAAVSFDVVFNDPGQLYTSYYAGITSNLIAAGDEWAAYFVPPTLDTTLTVSVGFASIATANGGSTSSSFVTSQNGLDIYEQGAAYKLRTGLDNNGAAVDIGFNIGIDGYLQNELWFDPTPTNLTDDVVPFDQTDARSVFLHEFGHAFGFNGWRNAVTGALPGGYASTFDTFTTLTSTPAGNTLVFTGENAQAVYGGPVPVTFGNYAHIGNNDPLPGADLINDLMNGVVYYRGTRYTISELDLAIMKDVGLPVITASIPEPQTYALMLAGLAVAGWGRKRRMSRAAN